MLKRNGGIASTDTAQQRRMRLNSARLSWRARAGALTHFRSRQRFGSLRLRRRRSTGFAAPRRPVHSPSGRTHSNPSKSRSKPTRYRHRRANGDGHNGLDERSVAINRRCHPTRHSQVHAGDGGCSNRRRGNRKQQIGIPRAACSSHIADQCAERIHGRPDRHIE